MKVLAFIKNNFIKLLIQTLIIMTLLISVLSIEFTIDILHNDGKSINYVGVVRGASQRLVKQELENKPNDQLIKQLDAIINILKFEDANNHLALHEDTKLQESLCIVEAAWIELKDEIYNHRAGSNSQRLYYLSEEYFELTNSLVFETQEYVESKVDNLASMRTRVILSIALILFFSIQQFISRLLIQNKNIELNNIAYIDSLTGLFNRAKCNEIISHYNEIQFLPNLACVYIDLNNLKTTNDLYGHDVGDRLIKDFGKILKESSNPYGFVCRNGGDEFVAIFENCTEKNIQDYINFLNEKVSIYNKKESYIQISFAWGVSFSSEIDTNNINELISLADTRMYINKAEYKRALKYEVK